MSTSKYDPRDQQCQKMLTLLMQQNICTKEQAAALWKKWNIAKKQHPTGHPYQFLVAQGLPMDALRQPTKTLATTPSPIQESEITRANNHLVKEIAHKKLLDAEILQTFLHDCNAKNTHLGQYLVKNHHLQMSDLIALMQSNPGLQSTVPRVTHAPALEITALGSDHFANYEILNEIARGGMGIVYRARQKRMKRIVALKVLLTGSFADSTQVRRFLREAKATASLDHPHIVPIYHMGEEKGYHYFTMKYIAGGTLQDIIDCNTTPVAKKISLLIKVCQALHHAHQKHILHRDIKPSNILLDEAGEPFITDFGLAKFLDASSSITKTGTAVGTPFYMAPEQVLGLKKKIDRRSDIYSLGVILYQILTEQLPFTGETLAEIHTKVVNQEPPLPRRLNPQVSKPLQDICLKCMDKLAKYRYESAQALADDLSRFCQGQKTQAGKLHLIAGILRCYRRHRRRFMVAGGCALLLVIIGITFYGFQAVKQAQEDQKNSVQVVIAQKCREIENILQKRNYYRAQTMLQKLADKYPQAAIVHLHLGRLYHKLQKQNAARKAFAKAYRLAPQRAEILYAKAVFHAAHSENKTALTLIDRYIEKKPREAIGYRQRAAIRQNLQQLHQARQDINIANQLEKEKLQKSLHLIQQDAQKNPQAALEQLKGILEEHPKYEKGYVQRAQIYYDTGEVQRALQDISQAVELNPCVPYYLQKGEWLYESGYYAEAKRNLVTALTSSSTARQQENIYRLLVEIALKQKHYQQAYDYCAKIVDKSAIVHLKIAQAAVGLKKYDLAQQHLQYAPKANGETSYYSGCIAQVRQKMPQAIQAWEQAIALGMPKVYRARLLLGKAYVKKRKFLQAIEHLSKAAQDLPEDVNIHRLLANCYIKTQKWSSAVEQLSRCIDLRPWIADFYYRRGLVYSKLEHFERSGKDFSTCIKLQPDNIDPFIKLILNAFEEGVIYNFDKLALLIEDFKLRTAEQQNVDLFTENIKRLNRRCIRDALALAQHQQQRRPWANRQAQILVNGLLTSDSPAVHQMAYTGLKAMYYAPQLHSLLQNKLQQKNLWSSAQKRLKYINGQIREMYFKEEKIRLRQRLVRLYNGRDQQALKEIYDQGTSGVDCLNSLLLDEQEHVVIRLLAAQALLDLGLRSSYDILHHNFRSGSVLVKFFAYAALNQRGFPVSLPQSFLQNYAAQPTYVRVIAIQDMAKSQHNLLAKLLNDPKVQVRLYAAACLRKTGNLQAEKILLQACASPSAIVRSFAIANYWHFESAKRFLTQEKFRQLYKRSLRNFERLATATKDKKAIVRRIAFARLAQVKTPQVKEILLQNIKEPDKLARFHVLGSLGRSGETSTILSIFTNPRETIFFRIAAFFGIWAKYCIDKKSSKWETPQAMLAIYNKVRNDPDPRVRFMAYTMMGRASKGIAINLMSHYFQSPDYAIRGGCALGAMGSSKVKSLPHLEKLLPDPHPMVRSLAATVAIYIAVKRNAPSLEHLHELCKKSRETRRGGAVGYRERMRDLFPDPDTAAHSDWKQIYRQYIDNMMAGLQHIKQRTQRVVTVHTPRGVKRRRFTLIADIEDYFSLALELDPQNDKCRFERGIVRYVRGKYEKSIEDVQKAISLRQDIPIFKLWLARIYYRAKQYSQALKISQQALQNFMWDYQAAESHAKILQAMRRKQQAKWWFDRALLLRRIYK